MRVQRSGVLCFAVAAAVAALTVASIGDANAQGFYGRAGFAGMRNGGPLLGPGFGRRRGARNGRGEPGRYRRYPGGGGRVIVAVPPAGDGSGQRGRPARRGRPVLARERRIVPDEVLVEVANSFGPRQLSALQRRFRLQLLESHSLALTGTTLLRWRIPDRRSVATVVREVERDARVISVQPNYLFALQQQDAEAPSEAAQYQLGKLNLLAAHRLAEGDNVLVAVIDSGIDAGSTELAGSIAGVFDALPSPPRTASASPRPPGKHGTAIAGLIAAHGKLVGAAPDARILAVRAFAGHSGGAQGTTYDILKGLDWAAASGARVVNMSFAGPDDRDLHRALTAAHRRGIVLVAAAGNAGANSPPLYPAADPNVIAVTATDAQDKLFAPANRGRQIAVSAPGVDLLVTIPRGYEVSSGTSYAAAEVSGIAALMLQRDPTLVPDKVRHTLEATARNLGRKGRDDLFGFGLVDAYAAVAAVAAAAAPVASTTPPPIVPASNDAP